ncbi:major facilitator superfamily transporter protein [Rutstroemia sp. NJR-2017a BBW]|nr:major facilitator superfamily transporter protein [Rutstroemia sp. NJR-2017a BBW]
MDDVVVANESKLETYKSRDHSITNEVAHDPVDTIEEHEYPGGLRLAAIVAALVWMRIWCQTIITTAIPSITNDFHSLEDVGWYGSAMFFPMAATQSVWGKCYNYFPVKRIFILSIAMLETGSLICVSADSWLTRSSPRTKQPDFHSWTGNHWIRMRWNLRGMVYNHYVLFKASNQALDDKCTVGDICHSFGSRSVDRRCVYAERNMAMVVRQLPYLQSILLIPSPSFYINLPFGGFAAFAMAFVFRPPKAAEPTPATSKEKLLQMDILGIIFICAAIVCFALSIQWAGVEKSWKSSDVRGTLVGTVIFVVSFGMDQWYQGERALIMPSFLKNRILLAVKGVSAISSGVHLIPLILGLTITQIVTGTVITITGIFNPFLILGPVIATIGSGLLMLLHKDPSTGNWIGFQILLGVGVGLCLTIPLMLSQVVVETKDVSISTPIIIFAQSMGSAFIIPAAQAIFQIQLIISLRTFAPDVDPLVVLGAGATSKGICSLPETSLPGIVESYVLALKHTYALGVAVAGVAFL